MCRLLAYRGSSIVIDRLLYQPKNSLINQSVNAKELEEPLNGDGFGIGWYTSNDDEPATFVSVNPAWSNRNLKSLAPRVRTSCLVAHVRAASVGEVSESNCHPFQFGNLLMAHNGGVEEFQKIKRSIRHGLSDHLYNWIKGQTDSEHIFASLINQLNSPATSSPDQVVEAFDSTFSDLKKLMSDNGIAEPAYLNMIVTNGKFLVGTRYVTDPKEEPLTLYHSEGSRFVVEDGQTRLEAPQDDDEAVMVVSEKLSDDKDWTLIPANHYVIVEESLNVRIRPIKV